jgi:hypothetical protein
VDCQPTSRGHRCVELCAMWCHPANAATFPHSCWCHPANAATFPHSLQSRCAPLVLGHPLFCVANSRNHLDTVVSREKYHISKYPTIKVYRRGVALKSEYRGQRSPDAIRQYVKELMVGRTTTFAFGLVFASLFVRARSPPVVGLLPRCCRRQPRLFWDAAPLTLVLHLSRSNHVFTPRTRHAHATCACARHAHAMRTPRTHHAHATHTPCARHAHATHTPRTRHAHAMRRPRQ